MLLVQESSAISGPKPLKISGQADKVENARRIVEQMLATNDVSAVHKGGLVGKSMGEVIVPRSAVGVIIGKGGEVIKRIANETGTKIQFKNDGKKTFFQNLIFREKNRFFCFKNQIFTKFLYF